MLVTNVLDIYVCVHYTIYAEGLHYSTFSLLVCPGIKDGVGGNQKSLSWTQTLQLAQTHCPVCPAMVEYSFFSALAISLLFNPADCNCKFFVLEVDYT